MDDSKIIELLFARHESALSEVSDKYSRLYLSVIRRILRDEGDIEECANDVLLGVWHSIPPNRPRCLSAYICGIARHIGIDKLRRNTSRSRHQDYTVTLDELEECLPDGTADTDAEEAQTIRETMTAFLRGLDPECEILFIRRYVYMETVAELAERFGLKENRISVKLYRARGRLKKLLEKEGITV